MHSPKLLITAVTILLLFFIGNVVAVTEDDLVGDDVNCNSEISGGGQNVFHYEDASLTSYTNSDSDHGSFVNEFSHELDSLTSSGVLSITMDVMLQSIVELRGLQNISIIGHNNPTINCNNSGGIYFEHCHNCTITGITWEKCGNTNGSKPAIELYDSSEIIIQNCTFKHSVTQALTLSEMSRFVTISSCGFTLNNGFKGHGVAVHYMSRIIHHSKFQFTISNCNFTLNGAGSMSVVHISPSKNKSMEKIYLTDLQFLRNLAIPIYISHQNIFASGCIWFKGNLANSSGGILITNGSRIVFHAACTKFINNIAILDGGALHVTDNSSITFEGNSTVTVNNNQAKYGAAFYIVNNSSAVFNGNTLVTVNNSRATAYGGAFCMFNSHVKFEENSTLQISNSKAENGGAIYMEYNCSITFQGNSRQMIYNNQATTSGGAFHLFNNSIVYFKGSPSATINNNKALIAGGAFTVFNNARISFEGNFTVVITNNQASRGGAFSALLDVSITFKGTHRSTVTIGNNKASIYGGAIYILTNCTITFGGNSLIMINDNNAKYGAGIYVSNNSSLTFKGTSTVVVNNNKATEDGGALYMHDSYIKIEHRSRVMISNNKAINQGGAFCLWHNCSLMCKEGTNLTFYNNSADVNGGAIFARDTFTFTIRGNAIAVLNNNKALGDGGALYAGIDSVVTFQENSLVKFTGNEARHYGGALYLRYSCDAVFQDNACIAFHNNTASFDGGALYAWDNSNVTIKGNATAICINNKALGDGGALYINVNSAITFKENSTANFKNNLATYFGGALGSNSNITFANNCAVTFSNNEASQGGAIFTVCNTVFKDNTTVHFDNNKATTLGGALHASELTFEGSSTVAFKENEAILNGGALYSINSSIIVNQNSTVMFITNTAASGGAVFISACSLMVLEHSNVTFDNNIAGKDGGAIYLSNQVDAVFNTSSAEVTFNSNIADNNGGAIYSKITRNQKYFNISEIHFSNNVARTAGNLLYIDVTKSCNGSCLADRMAGISRSDKEISTSPNLLKLYPPAHCISNNSAECERYYINNVMLGQEITIYACLLDHYNKPAEATQFKIIGDDNEFYSVQGSSYASISCNHAIDGISIIGNKSISTSSLNHSIVFTSYSTGKSVRKIVSVNLTIGLSPCHPGFQYHRQSQKCECYNNSGIVFCSGSSSAIKRGYWFGSVTGIPTVTFCPINYCNFTCCKTTNGYYELSPVRVDQCKSHRSGIACGSCEEGYTLSFDSPECIDVNKCTTGQAILIVTLTVFYWFIVIVAVFIIMYCQVSIGYFYAITYYYSVVDVLLSQHTDVSNRPYMYHTVTILSTIAKITPQFLGRLCLLENTSGIDQQFIHYVHPLAVSVILIIICWLARNSKRLSMIISKGIIRAICFLLLLSYTSMATTSLLLMRSLTFIDVDNVYTYLSPDIQYFHGRHLAYGIIAIIFTLLIVIGLPLLLLLEPFLNGKINFVKIKPLLDQFQGCYKDNYRWFAAYYMICRLIVISIIIANLSDAFIAQYLLITATTIMALIHLLLRPYVDNTLNMSDGAILQLMVLVTVLPLFEYFDTYDSTLVMAIIFVLVILPLIQFIVIKLITSKQTLKAITKKTINYFSAQNLAHEDIVVDNVINNTSTNFVSLTIDDNMRRNAIICEM